MKVIRVGSLIGILGVALACDGATGAEPEKMLKSSHENPEMTMPYLLRFPDNYDPARKYPLVLCFHGAGGRGSDNSGRGSEAGKVLRSSAVQAKYPCFVLQPQCPEGKRWVDADWSKGSYQLGSVPVSAQMRAAMEILNLVVEKYPVDRSRIYVTGQSMGGFATWDAILRSPGLFAAAVPVCGGGDPGEAARIKTLPIWTFHGDADETIPVTSTREMVAALRKEGSAVRYDELPGVGHGSWTEAWKTEELLPWLFQQKAGSAP